MIIRFSIDVTVPDETYEDDAIRALRNVGTQATGYLNTIVLPEGYEASRAPNSKHMHDGSMSDSCETCISLADDCIS